MDIIFWSKHSSKAFLEKKLLYKNLSMFGLTHAASISDVFINRVVILSVKGEI